MIFGKDNIERLPPPVGTSDWATFSRDSYCVDKTLIVKDLIDSRSRVVLFTRPRRFDIALKPLVEPFPAFIIEVKHTKSETDDLKALAADVLAQIDGKQYDTTFRAEGLTDIVKIGLAYYKNKVELAD